MQENSYSELAALSDNVLAVQARNSADAQAELVSRYLRLIRYYASRYASTKEDAEDLVQEGLITLLHAVSQYSEKRGAEFAAFARTCIVNRMRTLAKRESGSAAMIADVVQVLEGLPELTDTETPESILLEKENFAHCRMQVMALLSEREWEILQCVMSGDSYAKAAEKLHVSEKSVDNAMQRVRRKMRAVKSTAYFE